MVYRFKVQSLCNFTKGRICHLYPIPTRLNDDQNRMNMWLGSNCVYRHLSWILLILLKKILLYFLHRRQNIGRFCLGNTQVYIKEKKSLASLQGLLLYRKVFFGWNYPSYDNKWRLKDARRPRPPLQHHVRMWLIHITTAYIEIYYFLTILLCHTLRYVKFFNFNWVYMLHL